MFSMADFLMATYHKALICILSKNISCPHSTKNHLLRASRSLSWLFNKTSTDCVSCLWKNKRTTQSQENDTRFGALRLSFIPVDTCGPHFFASEIERQMIFFILGMRIGIGMGLGVGWGGGYDKML